MPQSGLVRTTTDVKISISPTGTTMISQAMVPVLRIYQLDLVSYLLHG